MPKGLSERINLSFFDILKADLPYTGPFFLALLERFIGGFPDRRVSSPLWFFKKNVTL